MFWKRSSSTRNLQPWEILQWWRQPQEYVPWMTIDIQKPFQHFSVTENKTTLVEFDDEVSLLNSESELKSVLEELEKKAKKKQADEASSSAANAKSQLLLKSSQIGKTAFLIKPFVEFSSPLAFWPPKISDVDLSLKFLFLESAESEQELERRFQQFTQTLQSDQIDAFVFQQSLKLFQELLKVQVKKTSFDALIDILTNFDAVILNSAQLVSEDYLKKVWQIPLFIFANQPEQAAFTSLLLQKSYQVQREQLVQNFRKLYFGRLLNWLVSREFSPQELSLLEPLIKPGKDQLVFINEEIFRLYKTVVVRSGVPVEIGELYGTEVYLERVLALLSKFPTADEFESSLKQGELYSVLLEETVRFVVRHTKDVTVLPKELLRTLIRVMIGRLVEFQSRKKESE